VILLSLCSITYADTLTTDELAQVAARINKDLPEMIGKSTLLTSVTVDSTTFHMHYRIVDQNVADINVARFSRKMKKTMKPTICSNKTFFNILSSGINLEIDLVDQKDHPISNLVYTAKDCK